MYKKVKFTYLKYVSAIKIYEKQFKFIPHILVCVEPR